MPVIVVEVMPKPELLDPAGKATLGAINRLGPTAVEGVRIGKRFELTVDGPVTAAILAEVRTLAEDLLSNAVIEDVVSVHLATSEDLLDELDEGASGETR
ncbi:MAG TPA: phosphoribosylformylglycinamidine synthase subunit PurS [Microbacteriaceae bacterium]|nr:phosphoribosylformylglycinamidine synthase subunit PurS [Microbacteriaceae bacterium]